MAKIIYIALGIALLLSGCGGGMQGTGENIENAMESGKSDTLLTEESSGSLAEAGKNETADIQDNGETAVGSDGQEMWESRENASERPEENRETASESQDKDGQRTQDNQESIMGTEVCEQIHAASLLETGLDNPAGELQDRCSGMMVRITAGNLQGSGVILRDDGRELLIITAGHVLDQAENGADIEFRDGFRVRTEVYQRAEEADLAVLRIPRDSLLETSEDGSVRDHGDGYLCCTVDQDAYDEVRVGDVVIAMGSYTGVAEDAYAGTLTEDYVYAEDFDAYMMLAKVPVKAGMSGGGLFDEQGRLLGILCGVSEDEEVAVAPLISVLAML